MLHVRACGGVPFPPDPMLIRFGGGHWPPSPPGARQSKTWTLRSKD